ncbi:MAG TPA: copper resistance protein B [Dokdonella sp.]
MSTRMHERIHAGTFACCIVLLAAAPLARAQLHAALEHEDEPRNEQPDPAPPQEDTRMPAMDHSTMHDGHPPAQTDATASDPLAPPQHAMGAMSAKQMVDVMGMDDNASFGLFTLDRFERIRTDDGYATGWNAEGWLGRDFDKLWFKSEGRYAQAAFEDADAQLLWSHAVAPYWDTQLGLRRDFGRGPDRTWAAFGVQGLAPYWFELGVTAYVGQHSRTALRVESSYDLLLTQRLIVQSRFELNAYGKSDPALGIGAGVSDAEFGLRLRYEIRREWAPYVGVEWHRRFGSSAGFASLDPTHTGDERVFDTQIVAGLRLWF